MTNIKRKKLKIKNGLSEIKNIKSINLTVKRKHNDEEDKLYYELPFLDDNTLVDYTINPMSLMRRFFTDDEIKFLSGEYDMMENPDAMCEGLGVDIDSEYTLEEIDAKLSEKLKNILLKENI